MLKVAICDDDIGFSGKFESMLLTIKEAEHIDIESDVYFAGEELVEAICKIGRRYDLIFLDIEMTGLDGLATAKEIRKVDDLTMLIYVTNYDSYAIEAYEVQPFQFIVKPVGMERFRSYFMKAYEKITEGPYYFLCEFKGKTHILRTKDIMYFKSNKRVIQVNMADGMNYKFYGKMKELEDKLKREKADFWRIHQSFLVNVRYIDVISYDHIILKNLKPLSISKDRRKLIGEKYCNYVKGCIVE